MTDPLREIRIGTMVKAMQPDPATYVRAIVRLGFESIQPFFWQTLGGNDLPRLAGELKEAIGDADVKVSALGMFGNPLEDRDLDRQTLKGWETLIDNAHYFGADLVAGFTGRIRGAKLPESLPRFKGVWGELARRAADKGVRIAFENCEMGGNWTSGDWNIAHNPDAWEMMFNDRPQREHRPGMGALPPDGQPDRPHAAAPQVGHQDLPCPRQGRDRTLGRGPRARHLRQAPLCPDPHARLRRQQLDATSSANCASRASEAASTSKAGMTRYIATPSK